eukprot:TRINITY_DN74357_c0_g1_i1.p1 TRINITY_DN74357_c0_g1~~TRINITY_DN74357_c0_g1_i1.p1  ORF type:complete len:486 (+),score=66.48 TRINITY_DN74357_c0_g1_i1:39-1460(+)
MSLSAHGLRVPRSGKFALSSLDSSLAATAIGSARHVSVISWNILAQCYMEGNCAFRYAHVDSPSRKWEARCHLIMEELIEACADIVVLQEVMFTAFETDLEPLLASLGYQCVMQNDRHRKDGHPTANATFFRTDRFELSWEEHRSRILLVGLRDLSASHADLCVCNAHLEGDPRQPLTRVQQAKSALEQAAKRCGSHPHALLLCGDFNAPLTSSAVASYLAFGAVVPGVLEFGREVFLPPQNGNNSSESSHPYSLQSAYAPDSTEFSFTLHGSAGPCLMLDQMWYDVRGLRCCAVRELFRSAEHRQEVLATGLPSAAEPSDHIPVGALFEVLDPPSLPPQRLTASAVSGGPNSIGEALTPADCAAQAEELWENCPLSHDDRQKCISYEEAVVAATPAPGRKPTAEELAAHAAAKEVRSVFLIGLRPEARGMLERRDELLKQARKLGQKVARKEQQHHGKHKNHRQQQLQQKQH